MNAERSRTEYLKELSYRLVELLESEPDADYWMSELAHEAEQRGWVPSASNLRRNNRWSFALDLFANNATAYERLPFVGFDLPDPESIEELCTFADFIV